MKKMKTKIVRNILAMAVVGLGVAMTPGVAQAEDPAPNPSQLLRAADTALYAAKNAGRDRVMVYQAKPSRNR